MLVVIQIIDKYSGHFVAEYWIKLKPPYNFVEKDCYNEAWSRAIADGRVSKYNRSDYQLIVVDEMLTHSSDY